MERVREIGCVAGEREPLEPASPSPSPSKVNQTFMAVEDDFLFYPVSWHFEKSSVVGGSREFITHQVRV